MRMIMNNLTHPVSHSSKQRELERITPMEHAISAVLKRDVPVLRLLIALNLLLTVSASAAPTVIGIGAFSGSETVIDFETIVQNEQVINQFTPIGATFSGDLFGDTFNLGFFFNTAPGSVIACNFINGTCESPDDCNGSFTVDFSPPVIRVGFDTITAGFGTTVTLFPQVVKREALTLAHPYRTLLLESRILPVSTGWSLMRSTTNSGLFRSTISDTRGLELTSTSTISSATRPRGFP